ncbi:alpha/beta hydrolase fold domain-containing protein [Micromonospora globispora]|uniref:alpha/beta hydrolase fold domain-containing protein n=1 Tax=Micromonospora globispora TaxID=1450148 RepID=UPI003C6DB753
MWTISDLESYDRACRRLALTTDTVVLSVDFRRAAEHPWPTAVDDCVDVVRWAATGGGSSLGIAGPTVVMGDSSGGNLATLTCLRLRDEGWAAAGRPGPCVSQHRSDALLSQYADEGHGLGLDHRRCRVGR